MVDVTSKNFKMSRSKLSEDDSHQTSYTKYAFPHVSLIADTILMQRERGFLFIILVFQKVSNDLYPISYQNRDVNVVRHFGVSLF